MKKTVTLILLVSLLSSVCLSGCAACEHEWAEATCLAPSTCTICGKVQGEVLEHEWAPADCENPEVCSLCHESRGEVLGHKWAPADCENPEVCSICNKTQGEPLGHSYSDDWILESVDIPNLTSVMITECTRCHGSDTKEEPLTDLIDEENRTFLFTPEEFLQLLTSTKTTAGSLLIDRYEWAGDDGILKLEAYDSDDRNVQTFFFASNSEDGSASLDSRNIIDVSCFLWMSVYYRQEGWEFINVGICRPEAQRMTVAIDLTKGRMRDFATWNDFYSSLESEYEKTSGDLVYRSGYIDLLDEVVHVFSISVCKD